MATELNNMAAQYRALAAELRALLPQIKMHENRAELLAMARKYEKLAERLERN